jgi:hypothetical protein
MTVPLLTPAAKGEWTELLDRIDATIAQALDEIAAHENALGVAEASDVGPKVAGLAGDRANGLRIRLDAAGRMAESVAALLAADEEEARGWVGLAARAGARLASTPASRL